MSQARVQTVAAARKPQGKCERCGTELPVGAPYRWYTVGFRSKYRHRRCMKSTCTPRASDLESSQMSQAYAAEESARDELAALRAGDPQDQQAVMDVMSTYADELGELASTYREADEAIGGGGYTESGERADSLEEAQSTIEGFYPTADPEDVEPCEKHTDAETALEEDDQFSAGDDLDAVREACDDCRELKVQAWDALLDEAEAALDEVSL